MAFTYIHRSDHAPGKSMVLMEDGSLWDMDNRRGVRSLVLPSMVEAYVRNCILLSIMDAAFSIFNYSHDEIIETLHLLRVSEVMDS